MTNSEHFEKNGISFAEAMKIFNKQKNRKDGTKSFDRFLASPYQPPCKFKPGDIIVLQLNPETRKNGWHHNAVAEVLDIEMISYFNPCYAYRVRFLTPEDEFPIGTERKPTCEFIDRNCILY